MFLVLLFAMNSPDSVPAATGYGPGAQPNVPPFIPPSVTPSRPSTGSGTTTVVRRERRTLSAEQLAAIRNNAQGDRVTIETDGAEAVINFPGNAVENLINDTRGDVVEFDLSRRANVELVHIPRYAVEQIANARFPIEVEFPAGTVRLDPTALRSILDRGPGEHLTIVCVDISEVTASELTPIMRESVRAGERVFVLRVYLGTQRIGNFDGMMTVIIPHNGPFPATVCHLDPQGVRTRAMFSCDVNARTVTFMTARLSHFVIGFDGAGDGAVAMGSTPEASPAGGSTPQAPLTGVEAGASFIDSSVDPSPELDTDTDASGTRIAGIPGTFSPGAANAANPSTPGGTAQAPAPGSNEAPVTEATEAGFAEFAMYTNTRIAGGRSEDNSSSSPADITARENPQTGINPAILSYGTLSFGGAGVAGLLFYLRYRLQLRRNSSYNNFKDKKRRKRLNDLVS
jgi:hypothetical protein